MDFLTLSPHPVKKLGLDQFIMGEDTQNPSFLLDQDNLYLKKLDVDTEIFLNNKNILEYIGDNNIIVNFNSQTSEFNTSIELIPENSSYTFLYEDINFSPLNDSRPTILFNLRQPQDSEIMYAYNIKNITSTEFTFDLSDKITEENVFLDVNISQRLSQANIDSINSNFNFLQIKADTLPLTPNSDQINIVFDTPFSTEDISIVATIKSTSSSPIISHQIIQSSSGGATIQFSDDVPNNNYFISYLAYPKA